MFDPRPAGKLITIHDEENLRYAALLRGKLLKVYVAQVVQMLDREENSSNTFDACLPKCKYYVLIYVSSRDKRASIAGTASPYHARKEKEFHKLIAREFLALVRDL